MPDLLRDYICETCDKTDTVLSKSRRDENGDWVTKPFYEDGLEMLEKRNKTEKCNSQCKWTLKPIEDIKTNKTLNFSKFSLMSTDERNKAFKKRADHYYKKQGWNEHKRELDIQMENHVNNSFQT